MIHNILNEHAVKRLRERYNVIPSKELCLYLKQCILNRNKHRKLLYHDILQERFVYRIDARSHGKGFHRYFVIVTDKNRDSIFTFLPEDWSPSDMKVKHHKKIINNTILKISLKTSEQMSIDY